MKPSKMWLILAIALLWASQAHSQEEPANDILIDENPNNVEETLIDFTEFEELIQASGIYEEGTSIVDKNIGDLSPEEVDAETLAPIYEIQASDYNFNRWQVEFNPSSNYPVNRQLSYAKKVNLKEGKAFQGPQTEAGREARGTGNTVLGVRIHFSNNAYNSHVRIAPPYEIQAHDNEGRVVSRRETGKRIGIIDNVGNIKRMTLDVSGRNYNYGVSIRLKNQLDQVQEYFMGYIHFVGWRRLHWVNPSYVSTVDYRQLFRVPLYPMEMPYVKFDSLIVYRPSYSRTGGDFVVYFRKIDMWFDFSVPPEALNDVNIDDEQTWGILTQRAEERKYAKTLEARERVELLRAEALRMRGNVENIDPTAEQEPQ